MSPPGPTKGTNIDIYFNQHYTGAEYAFDTTRKADHIADAIRTRPGAGVDLVAPPSPAIDAAIVGIEALHTADYVDALRHGTDRPLAESQGFTWDAGIWAMAVHSTAGVIAAADSALEHGVAGSLSSGLHHAKPGTGDGYCTVNGLVIAAARIAGPASDVVILDLDAHCGGGTNEMLSAHGLGDTVRHHDLSTESFDRYTPADPRDHLVIVDSGNDDVYLAEVQRLLDTIAWRHTRLVLYNAGMDPHPRISRPALEIRERLVFERAADEGVPIAWVLAGGYTFATTMSELVDLHWLTIDAATHQGASDEAHQ